MIIKNSELIMIPKDNKREHIYGRAKPNNNLIIEKEIRYKKEINPIGYKSVSANSITHQTGMGYSSQSCKDSKPINSYKVSHDIVSTVNIEKDTKNYLRNNILVKEKCFKFDESNYKIKFKNCHKYMTTNNSNNDNITTSNNYYFNSGDKNRDNKIRKISRRKNMDEVSNNFDNKIPINNNGMNWIVKSQNSTKKELIPEDNLKRKNISNKSKSKVNVNKGESIKNTFVNDNSNIIFNNTLLTQKKNNFTHINNNIVSSSVTNKGLYHNFSNLRIAYLNNKLNNENNSNNNHSLSKNNNIRANYINRKNSAGNNSSNFINNDNNSINRNNISNYINENSNDNSKIKDGNINYSGFINSNNNFSKAKSGRINDCFNNNSDKNRDINFCKNKITINTNKSNSNTKSDIKTENNTYNNNTSNLEDICVNISNLIKKKDSETINKSDSNDKNNIETKKISSVKIITSGNNISPKIQNKEKENIFLLDNSSPCPNQSIHYDNNLNNKNNTNQNTNQNQIQFKRHKILYVLDDTIVINKKSSYEITYSTEKEYDTIIYDHIKNKIYLSKCLLELNERKWLDELLFLSEILLSKRNQFKHNMNSYLKKLINIYEHFNWLVNSISTYFNCLMFQNEKEIFDSVAISEIKLPDINSTQWFNGFKWKGLYIYIHPLCDAKHIINEIKALNYYFFDYLQIIEKFKTVHENQLSNLIIFPLAGYSIINGFVLYVSLLIKPDNTHHISNNDLYLKDIIHYNEGYLEFYSNTQDRDNINNNLNFNKKNNETNNNHLADKLGSKYYIEDLLSSRLFSDVNENHLIPVQGGKLLLFNVYNLLPNLFEIKFNDIQKYHFYSVIENKMVYYTLDYDYKTKKNINKLEKTLMTPNDIAEKIYNLNILPSTKTKDILINNVHFRIIYEKIGNNPHRNQNFVDYLFNHYNNDNIIENDIEKNNGDYIADPYVIMYELINPIKLKYSLIKSIKADKNTQINISNDTNNYYNENHNSNNEVINSMYFLITNYVSYYLSWCKSLNNNYYNIKRYSDLKEIMKKLGIDTHLNLFTLVNVDNEEISDIIKIALLVKALAYIFNKKDNQNLYKTASNKTKRKNIINFDFNINNNLLEEERKSLIFYFIHSILYPNEVSKRKTKIQNFFEQLIFYVNVIFIKLKLIDDYLCLGLLNNQINKQEILIGNQNVKKTEKLPKQITGFDSTKEFLKHIIYVARKKPFLFISELENKLRFVIDPFVKIRSSFSLESMHSQLEIKHISLINNNLTYSFVNCDELSSLLFTKILHNYNKKNKIDEINSSDDEDDDSIMSSNNVTDVSENEKFMNNNEFGNNDFRDIYSNIKNKNSKCLKISTNLSILDEEVKENKDIKETKDVKIKKKNPNDSKKNICLLVNLPSICYKMKFKSEKNKKNLYYHLRDIYIATNSKILEQWYDLADELFNKIYSCSGRTEHAILNSLIYLYFSYLLFEKSYQIKCQPLIENIKNIYIRGGFQLSLVDLTIINLFKAINNSKKYFESEEPFSKCIMLILMMYGDPRGRNNDSHGLLQYPLWQIARKTYKLKEILISEYFQEMYQCLDFVERQKIESVYVHNKLLIDYSKNINENLDKIFLINKGVSFSDLKAITSSIHDIDRNINEKQNLNYLLINSTDKDLTLNNSIFEKMADSYKIKYFTFPIVKESNKNIDEIFSSKEFLSYLVKEMQSILLGNQLLLDENYINDQISDEIFDPYDYNDINLDNKTDNSHSYVNIINQDEWYDADINSPQNEQQKRQIGVNQKMDLINFENRTPIFTKNKFPSNFIQFDYNNIKGRKTAGNRVMNETVCYKSKDSLKFKSKKKYSNSVFSHILHKEIFDKLSFKKNLPSGILMGFGNNSHNEISYDDEQILVFPRFLFKLKNVLIDKIYSGWEHNIAISDNGEIYSFGHNQSYQCGVPNKKDQENIIDPINISTINKGIRALSAACGNEHTLILSKDHDVYSFGNNEDGVLGMNKNNNNFKTFNFNKINIEGYANRIKAISAGTVHNMLLTDDGKIFSWGSSQGGQLGLSEQYLLNIPNFKENYYISKPTLVPFKTDDFIKSLYSNNNRYGNSSNSNKVIKISCGEAHSMALTENYEIYSWGFGSNGQLGLNFCEDSFPPGTGLTKSRRFTPTRIKKFTEDNSQIIDIQCGKTFSMFIDIRGGLYACGINDLNQLGISEMPNKNHLYNRDTQCNDFVFPRMVDYLLKMKVEHIACGEGHCVAIIQDTYNGVKNVWSWGNNRYGQLGIGEAIKKSLPKPINYFIEFKSILFHDVSCGGFHSLCLLKYKDGIDWIKTDYHNICKLIDDLGIN